MSSYTFLELQKCAEREVALRRNVYKKRGWSSERAREIAMMDEIAKHLAVQAQIGATGDFPEGKLDEHDEGGLRLAIGSQIYPEGRVVRIEFGKKIAWIGLPRRQAVEFASSILKHAGVEIELEVRDA